MMDKNGFQKPVPPHYFAKSKQLSGLDRFFISAKLLVLHPRNIASLKNAIFKLKKTASDERELSLIHLFFKSKKHAVRKRSESLCHLKPVTKN